MSILALTTNIGGLKATWMARANNPLHSDADRKVSYDAYEVECWAEAVMEGRLRISDLERKWQEPVTRRCQMVR